MITTALRRDGACPNQEDGAMPDPTTDPDGQPNPPAPPTADPPAPPELGDAGKKALDAEREARRAAESKAKEYEAELAKFRQEQMSEHEKAIEAAKAAAAAEADQRWTERLVKAEAKAAAAGKVVDVDTAVKLLDLSKVEIADGTVDSAALASLIDALVAEKPFLAATAGTPKLPTPTVPGGPRGDGKGSITHEQLKTMSPEEVSAAYQRGDLKHLLGG